MANIHYGTYGNGPPLVLLCGITGSIDQYWRTILPSLTKDHQCVLIDNRGAGKSDSPDEPYTIEMMAEDAIGVIRKLKLEKPSILGHSMGGAIALTLARHFASEIDQLILMNAFPKFSQRTTIAYLAIDRLLKEGYSQDKAFWLVAPWLYSEEYLRDPKRIDDLGKYAMTTTVSIVGFSRQLQAIIQFDARSWLNEIQSETLVIAAQDDILTPPSQSEELSEHIPNSHLAILEGGHCPHIEHARDLIKLVLDFLE